MEWFVVGEWLASLGAELPPGIEDALDTIEDLHGHLVRRRDNERGSMANELVAPNSTVTPMVARLSGRNTAIRLVEPHDYDWMHALLTEEGTFLRYRLNGQGIAPEQMTQELWGGVDSQFVICLRGDRNRRLGVVTFYGYRSYPQVVSLAVVLAPDVRSAGWGWEGVLLAVDHFRRAVPVRKICLEVGEFNLASFASLERLGAELEGVQRNHDWVDGRLWDRYLYAFHFEPDQSGAPAERSL